MCTKKIAKISIRFLRALAVSCAIYVKAAIRSTSWQCPYSLLLLFSFGLDYLQPFVVRCFAALVIVCPTFVDEVCCLFSLLFAFVSTYENPLVHPCGRWTVLWLLPFRMCFVSVWSVVTLIFGVKIIAVFCFGDFQNLTLFPGDVSFARMIF